MRDPWADTRSLDELRRRLKWFLLGRLLVVSSFFLVFAFGFLKRGAQDYIVSVNWLLFTIVATYAVTLVSALLLNRLASLRLFTHAQVAFDLALITGVIYLTGGFDSPFAFLYSLSILNGATLLLSGGAIFTAVMASADVRLPAAGVGAGVIEGFQVFLLPPPGIDAAVGEPHRHHQHRRSCSSPWSPASSPAASTKPRGCSRKRKRSATSWRCCRKPWRVPSAAL